MPRIPGVNHRIAVRALEKAGFRITRQGKHIIMSDGVRKVYLPRQNPIDPFTMGGIVAQAGLTVTVPPTAITAISPQGQIPPMPLCHKPPRPLPLQLRPQPQAAGVVVRQLGRRNVRHPRAHQLGVHNLPGIVPAGDGAADRVP